MRAPALTALALVLASACATPATTPAPAVPASWEALAPLPSSQLAEARDATLDLILARLQSAPDLEAARARAAAAEARADALRASLLPSLSATATASRATAQPGLAPPGTGRVDGRSASLALDLPLDLAGAGRARAGSARAEAVAAEAEAARVALITRRTAAMLLDTYRAARDQAVLVDTARTTAARTATLVADRAQAGLASGLELAQARQAAEGLAARLPGLVQARQSAARELEVLAGLTPGALEPVLLADQAPPPAAIPVLDAPAEVLERRPDVRAAEALARAAGLDARAARRDRWPTVSLNALIGRSDPGFASAADVDSLALTLLAPVFDFGRLDSLARASGARAEEAAAIYRKALVSALADVVVSASAVTAASQTQARQAEATEAAARREALTADRQQAGLASLIDLLEARQQHLEARLALVLAVQAERTAIHTLAAAAGG